MEKNIKQMDGFKIIGIAIETTNENGQSAQAMGNLWGRFFSEGISAQIPNKLSEEIYAIYTDYETDYRGKYTAIIGCKVSSLEEIPLGMIGRAFHGENYQKFTAKGAMPSAVQTTWLEIWKKDEQLNRSYSADFEIYGANSQNGGDSEVDIYVGVR